MDYYLIIYYLAGILQDFLVTLNVRFIAKGKIGLAVIFSFVTTVVALLIIYNILTQLEAGKSIIAIVIYALGIATGTFFAMKIKAGFKD